MNQNILIFDTETTGLPKFKKNMYKKESNPFNDYHSPSQYKYYDGSRLIELGYLIYNSNRELILSKSILIKPDRFLIQNSNIHGIEHDFASQNGKVISEVLKEFAQDITSCNTLVAHNLPFDFHILLSECYRFVVNTPNGLLSSPPEIQIIINKFKVMEKFCTMTDGMRIMNLTRRPKLSVLYQDLTKNTWEQKHRAEDDAKACAECYWKLLDIQKDNYQKLINT